ncbi:hypothetical protein PENTCL1PPCAC_23419, partial [Pristionchus entomophagus]
IYPLAVDGSTDYSFIISVDNSLILFKRERNKWACRALQLLTIEKERPLVMMIPGMEIAVVGGRHYILFIATSFHQATVSSTQLRILNNRVTNITIRAMTSSTVGGITYVYILGDEDLSVWKIEKDSPSFIRTVQNMESLLNLRGVDFRNQSGQKPAFRKESKVQMPDGIYDYPLSAITMRRNTGDSVSEYLIVSHESGVVKVQRTEDIHKNPVCSYIPLGKEKLPVQILYPCWEFPLDPITPLTTLIGLSDGIPIIIKLMNGTWNTREIGRNVAYSHVKSKVAVGGHTVTVFHNKNEISFCLFNKEELRWREDCLSCEIKDIFISSRIVAIVTDEKILLVHIYGLFNEEEGVNFYNASLDHSSLKMDTGSAQSREVVSILAVQFKPPQGSTEEMCFIQFKSGITRNVVFNLSPMSLKTSLQELYDGLFTGTVICDPLNSQSCMREVVGNSQGIVFKIMENRELHGYSVCEGARSWRTTVNSNIPKTASIIGFIAIEARDTDNETFYILARERTENGDLLYIRDVSSQDDISMEPIPADFGDNPVFGHFVGPKEHGRCVLYTTCKRKYGTVPKLIRLEARVSHARHKETLIYSRSLFQPDTAIRLVNHKSSSCKSITTVVSTYGNTIELQELNGKGKLILKKEIQLKTAHCLPIFISSFSTYFVHSSNTLFVVAGSFIDVVKSSVHKELAKGSTGELFIVACDLITNEHTCKVTNIEEPSVREVFFFGKEHPTNPPTLVVYLNDTVLKVFRYDHQSESQTKASIIHQIVIPKDRKESLHATSILRVRLATTGSTDTLVTCNGDDSEIHDIWMINHQMAYLHPGRKSIFGQKILTFPFSSWRGETESIFLLSTRTNDTSGLYADFVFVVKDRCKIGILATVQTIGQIPQAILFAKLCEIPNTLSIVIHGEILNSSVHEPAGIDVTIRLFIAKNESVMISHLRLSIDSDGLKVEENVELGLIPMTISDPSHFVVSAMEETPDRVAPKYGIVSGVEGTNIIRICANKLQRP